MKNNKIIAKMLVMLLLVEIFQMQVISFASPPKLELGEVIINECTINRNIRGWYQNGADLYYNYSWENKNGDDRYGTSLAIAGVFNTPNYQLIRIVDAGQTCYVVGMPFYPPILSTGIANNTILQEGNTLTPLFYIHDYNGDVVSYNFMLDSTIIHSGSVSGKSNQVVSSNPLNPINLTEGNHVVTLNTYDGRHSVSSSFNFIVKKENPIIKSISSDSIVNLDERIDIKANISYSDVTGINSYNIIMNGVDKGWIPPNQGNDLINYTVDTIQSGSDKVELVVRAKDHHGLISQPTTYSFYPGVTPVKLSLKEYDQETVTCTFSDANTSRTKYKVKVNDKWLGTDGKLTATETVLDIPTKSFVIKELKPKTQYSIQMIALNGYDPNLRSSQLSSPLVVNTLARGPAIPQNFRAGNITSSSVELEWDSVVGASHYVIEQDGVIVQPLVYESKCSIKNLVQNKEYNFKILARTEDGVDSKKASLNVRTHNLNLKAPTNITTPYVTSNNIKLSWNEVNEATGYDIERNGVIIANDCPEATYTVQNIAQNEKNIYRVRSRNEQGESSWSQPISRYTTINPENILLNEQGSSNQPQTNPLITIDGAIEDWATIKPVSQVPNNTVKLHMVQSPQKLYLMANGVDTTKPINFYIDSDKNVSTGYKESPWKNAGADYRIEGDVLYKYTGTGADWSWTNVGSVTTAKTASTIESMVELSQISVSGESLIKLGMNVDPLTLPTEGDGMVTALGDTSGMDTVTTIKSTQIGLSWKGISGAMSYQLEADGEMVYEDKLPTFTHKGLNPETQHSYRLRVKNLGGWGPWSNVLTLMTSNGIPKTAPTDITTSATDESIAISWKPLDEAEGYEVIEIINGQPGQIFNNNKGTTCLKRAIKHGTTHIYRVRGKNSIGEGPWSSDITATTFKRPTPVVTNSVERDSAIIVEWAPSEEAANSFVPKFDAMDLSELNTTVTTGSSIVANTPAPIYELKVEGPTGTSIIGISQNYTILKDLVPETRYTVSVRTLGETNALVDGSAWSKPVPIFTTPIRPAVPQNVGATVTDSTISMNWDAVAGAVGYDIELDGVLLENDGENQYTHEELEPLTFHHYRVRARNGLVEGDWSAMRTIRTMPAAPVPPKDITIKSNVTSALIQWPAIPGALGYDVEITNGSEVSVIENINKNYFLHRKVGEGREMRYRIRTRNIQGESEWTPIIINNAIKAICTKQGTLDLGLTAHDVMDFNKYTMVVTYNKGVVDVEDLSTKTGGIELSPGRIEGTDITIVAFEPGYIVFKCDKAVEPDESWTGIINSIKFKAKHKGGTTITYTVHVDK